MHRIGTAREIEVCKNTLNRVVTETINSITQGLPVIPSTSSHSGIDTMCAYNPDFGSIKLVEYYRLTVADTLDIKRVCKERGVNTPQLLKILASNLFVQNLYLIIQVNLATEERFWDGISHRYWSVVPLTTAIALLRISDTYQKTKEKNILFNPIKFAIDPAYGGVTSAIHHTIASL